MTYKQPTGKLKRLYRQLAKAEERVELLKSTIIQEQGYYLDVNTDLTDNSSGDEDL